MDWLIQAIREVLIDKVGDNWALYMNQTLTSFYESSKENLYD